MLDHALADLLVTYYGAAERELGSPEWLRFERDLGLDPTELRAHVGFLSVVPIRLHADRTFVFDESGRLGAVVEALAEDGVTPIDLVGWLLHRPDAYCTALGRARALGIGSVRNPATYAFGGSLRVHKTPLDWLRSGCDGCVPLDERSAPAWLGSAPGPIVVDDLEHGREVARMVGRRFPRSKILAPVRESV